MMLSKFSKASADRILYTVDYSQWLGGGETVSAANFVVETVTSPALVVDGVSVDSATHTLVSFYASAGLTANTYTVTVTATTSLGQTKEDYVLFVVKDPP